MFSTPLDKDGHTRTGRHSRHSTTLTNTFFLFIDNVTSEICLIM